MATFDFSKSSKTDGGGYLLGRIVYDHSQSTSGNSSTMTFTVYVKKAHDTLTLNVATIGDFQYVLTINGVTKTGTAKLEIYESFKKINSFTMTVPHNSDGTKTVNVSGYVWLNSNSSSAYYHKKSNVNKNITLPTIPRASSISSVSNVTLGNACNVQWTPLASSFSYKVKLECGGISTTSDYISPGSTSAYSYTSTMSISKWAAAMPNSYSGTCTATLYTYTSVDTDPIGSSSATFTLTLPKNADTTPSVVFANPTLINGWNGYYIQGKSSCKLSATFKSGLGSAIKSCSITGTGLSMTGSSTSLSGETGVFTKSGTFTYTASVADGRASVSTSKSVYVYPYANPTLAFAAARTSVSGSVKFTYSALCSSIESLNNLVVIEIYSKSSLAQTWPSSPSHTIQLTSTSANDSVILSGFDGSSSYDFKAKVKDTYGSWSAYAIASVASDFRIVNIKKRSDGAMGGISVGKMYDEASGDNDDHYIFDCALPARFLQNVEFGKDIQGNLKTDNTTADDGTIRNVVYIQTGQNVSGGSTMGLAVHNASVYVENAANTGKVNLGSSGRKWNQLYAANGEISTSDKKVKTNIHSMSNTQEQLFQKLQPVTFEFTNGTSGRTHYGFISQDIEDALSDLSLTGQDFAGFCKDLIYNDHGEVMLDENGQKVYDYSLRYSEFIALNTFMIQKLQAENAELRAELQELKELIVGTSSKNIE